MKPRAWKYKNQLPTEATRNGLSIDAWLKSITPAIFGADLTVADLTDDELVQWWDASLENTFSIQQSIEIGKYISICRPHLAAIVYNEKRTKSGLKSTDLLYRFLNKL